MIVPFSSGSATDVIAPAVFEQVGSQIGQIFIIDNRFGGGGTLGANAVANVGPDGYKLLVNSSPLLGTLMATRTASGGVVSLKVMVGLLQSVDSPPSL